MCQGKDDLAGQVLLDLSQVRPQSSPVSSPADSNSSSRSSTPQPIIASPSDHEDRRFTFTIAIGPTEDHVKARSFVLQAQNTRDMWEWLTTVNNLAGTPFELREGSPVSCLKP